MRTAVKNYGPALACTMTVALCYLLVRPYAEIGINDDWVYIWDAWKVAVTGHISYSGVETPMLGWQLYFGALFVKLFGFSFTAVRCSTAIEAMATAWLLQRTSVRFGLNTWNATLTTLTFVLSQLYFPLAFTFMTDISGVFFIVTCLYMCLRAVQAKNEQVMTTWVVLAALVNALGGTARQIVWLGVLVMVPSTLWLLRKNRRVLVVGSLSCIAGAVFVAACMQWFSRQPYSVPESLNPGTADLSHLRLLAGTGLQCVGALTLWALPVILMFTQALRPLNRRMAAAFGAGFLCFAIAEAAMVHAGQKFMWLGMIADDYYTGSAFRRLGSLLVQETHLAIVNDGFCSLLISAMLLGLLSVGACFFRDAPGRPASQFAAFAISWQTLCVIFGPFCLAYIALLVPRAMNGHCYGRYLLPLLAVFLLALARFYQERVHVRLPLACAFLIAILGAFSLAATHDVFALYRGYVTAIDEIRSSGVPATAITGPYEFEGWTQIEKTGHLSDPKIPQNTYVPPPSIAEYDFRSSRSIDFLESTPTVSRIYVVVLHRGESMGQVALPPVAYGTWIAPHNNWVYAVKLPANFPQ